MCTAPFLDLICNAGVDSLKIEGRAKTFYYVASVTAAYRRALDQYLADPMNENFELPEEVLAELTRTSHRHYSPGFYFGREQARQATDSATYIREWEFVRWMAGRTASPAASSGASGASATRWKCSARMAAASR